MQTRRCRAAPASTPFCSIRSVPPHPQAAPKALASLSLGHERAALAGKPKGTDRKTEHPVPPRNCLSAPGFEPGLSRPQRDVLTTRRCGLEIKLAPQVITELLSRVPGH